MRIVLIVEKAGSSRNFNELETNLVRWEKWGSQEVVFAVGSVQSVKRQLKTFPSGVLEYIRPLSKLKLDSYVLQIAHCLAGRPVFGFLEDTIIAVELCE